MPIYLSSPVLLLEDVLKYAGLISSFLKLKLGGTYVYQLPNVNLFEVGKLLISIVKKYELCKNAQCL